MTKYVSVKCFDFRKQFTGYIDYMAQYLETKRLVPDDIIYRSTNHPRNKGTECLLNDTNLTKMTTEYLLNHATLEVSYYSFCHKCLGSEDDLLAVWV